MLQTYLLYVHIAAGTIALFSAAAALATRKGGKTPGQPKSRVQSRIGASRAGLRPILSRSSPMDKSGLKFC